jgi:hypothetical protein
MRIILTYIAYESNLSLILTKLELVFEGPSNKVTKNTSSSLVKINDRLDS